MERFGCGCMASGVAYGRSFLDALCCCFGTQEWCSTTGVLCDGALMHQQPFWSQLDLAASVHGGLCILVVR
jgi:hypothetical protein